MAPPTGSPAPDFTLPDQHGTPVTLSGLRGRTVVVVFYPFAFTGVCTGELCALRDDVAAFDDAGVTLLAVSCDPRTALRVFADREAFPFRLLSDFWPHGAAARAYGVFDDERGCALRGTFVVDASGTLRWSVVNAIPDARDIADYKRAIAEIAA